MRWVNGASLLVMSSDYELWYKVALHNQLNRSKKALIDSFIAGINDIDDVLAEWRRFVAEQKEKELLEIIQSENLKEEETRQFISDSF
mgnify:CR=1 FL=1